MSGEACSKPHQETEYRKFVVRFGNDRMLHPEAALTNSRERVWAKRRICSFARYRWPRIVA